MADAVIVYAHHSWSYMNLPAIEHEVRKFLVPVSALARTRGKVILGCF